MTGRWVRAGTALAVALVCAIVAAAAVMLGGRGASRVAADDTPPAIQWCALATPTPVPTPAPTLLPGPSPKPTPTPVPGGAVRCEGDAFAS